MARILVIDDDKLIRLTLRRVLERMGHIVLEAADGSDGLQLCTSEAIDLVITDIYMPIINGLETIAMLRRWGLNTPILAMSGGVPGHSLDVLLLALEQGANMTLVKPYALDEVRSAVTTLLALNTFDTSAPRSDGQAAHEDTPPQHEAQS